MDATDSAVQTIIRRFQPDDRAPVLDILRRIPQFTDKEVVVAGELIDCYLIRHEASGYHIKTVEIGLKIVGYICYGPAPLTRHTWDIYWIAVDPEVQNHGTGRKLMVMAEKEISAAGGRIIMVETSSKPDYEATRKFYLNLGYRVEARITDFYDTGDDKVLLVKRIDILTPTFPGLNIM